MRGSLAIRFEARVDRSGGADACHLWTGARTGAGYGHLRGEGGSNVYAHRYALEMKLGRPLAPGMMSCHTCDNPPCVNGAHLFEDGNAGNVRDMFAKGRARPGLILGEAVGTSKLTTAQVVEIRQRFANGGTSKAALARDYGVHPSSVWRIVSGLSWRSALVPA
jgi:hypothetical protein